MFYDPVELNTTAHNNTEVVTKDIRDVVQNYKNTVYKVNIFPLGVIGVLTDNLFIILSQICFTFN